MLKRRKSRAGLSLFGVLLALSIFGVLVAGGMEWLQERARERLVKVAGAQAISLSEAAGSWVESDLAARLAAGAQMVPLATLRAAGVLAPGFAQDGIDALGRDLRVFALPVGADVLDVLVTHVPRVGDEVFPIKAVLVGGGKARIGVMHPGEAILRGPTIAADVSAFRVAFAGAPVARAIGVLERYDNQSVYGDFLYRNPVAGLAGANRMETTLDMGGNDLVGVQAVEADRMVLENGLEVGGDLQVTADFLVDGGVLLSGTADVTGAVTAGSVDVAGAVTAASAGITGEARAGSVVAAGAVRGGSIGTGGVLSAGNGVVTGPVIAGSVGAASVTVATEVLSGSVNAGSMTAGTAAVSGRADVAGALTARSVRATTRLDAASAAFSSLVVGVCTGC